MVNITVECRGATSSTLLVGVFATYGNFGGEDTVNPTTVS